MGERTRLPLGDHETGRCACGRRGEDGFGVCLACQGELEMNVTNKDRISSEVRDVTEQYKKAHQKDAR